MAFSPDGKLVASGSFDNTVRISQVSDGSLVREIKVRDPGCGCGLGFCSVVGLGVRVLHIRMVLGGRVAISGLSDPNA